MLHKLGFARSLAITMAISLCVGCGSSSDGPFRISGKATYNGAPIPTGRIVFEPDAARGNSGPQGFAVIKNGLFDTANNGAKGHIGGPMLIKIDGYDGVIVDQLGPPLGTALFPSTDVRSQELPKQATLLDFDVKHTVASKR